MFTFNDGKIVDPRNLDLDLEETPSIGSGGPPPQEIPLQAPKFFTVESKDDVRPCYVCARLCIERADYGPYDLPLHPGCHQLLKAENVRK